jgi:hypothetical protein
MGAPHVDRPAGICGELLRRADDGSDFVRASDRGWAETFSATSKETALGLARAIGIGHGHVVATVTASGGGAVIETNSGIGSEPRTVAALSAACYRPSAGRDGDGQRATASGVGERTAIDVSAVTVTAVAWIVKATASAARAIAIAFSHDEPDRGPRRGCPSQQERSVRARAQHRHSRQRPSPFSLWAASLLSLGTACRVCLSSPSSPSSPSFPSWTAEERV